MISAWAGGTTRSSSPWSNSIGQEIPSVKLIGDRDQYRSRLLRVRTDEGEEVPRLELVGPAGDERLEVGQTEVAGPRREPVVHREGAEGRVAAGAPAGDQEPIAVDLALVREPPRRGDAVRRIDDAPVPVETLSERAPETGAPPVVDVDDREPPARPELHLEGEARRGLRRRPSVAHHDERRPLAVRPGRVAVPGRIEVRERGRRRPRSGTRSGEGSRSALRRRPPMTTIEARRSSGR